MSSALAGAVGNGQVVIHESTTQLLQRNALNLSLLKLGPITATVVGGAISLATVVSAAAVIAVLTITTTPLPPTAYPDRVSVVKGQTKDLRDLLVNDVDPKGSNLTIAAVSQPQWGRAVLLDNKATVRYIAPAHWAGIDTFNYTISNRYLESTATISVEVLNTRPSAADLHFSCGKNAKDAPFYPLSYVDPNTGARVKDVDGDELFMDAVSLVDPAASAAGHAIRIADDNKTVIFTAAPDFSGTVVAQYRVTDRNDSSNAAQLFFHIANIPPKAFPDIYTGLQKDLVYDLKILDNDQDGNGDELYIKEVYNVCDGANVFIRPSTTKGKYIQYVPSRSEKLLMPRDSNDQKRFGCAFQYTITDGEAVSSSQVYVSLKNALPYIDSSVPIVIPKNSNGFEVSINAGDKIDIFDEITVRMDPSIIVDAQSATVVLNGSSVEYLPYLNTGNRAHTVNEWKLVFTPRANAVYDTKVGVIVDDGFDSVSGEIDVQVVNTAPTAFDVTPIETCEKNLPCTLTIVTPSSATDLNGDDLAVDAQLLQSASALSSVVSAIPGQEKKVRIDKAAPIAGTDSFNYAVTDLPSNTAATALSSNVAKVTFTVVNTAPVAKDDTYTVSKKSTGNIFKVLTNDVDANGDVILVRSVSQSSVSGGSVSINQTGDSLIYNAPAVGCTDTFTYVITDGDAQSAPATVTVMVINDAPSTLPKTTDVHWTTPEPVVIADIADVAFDPNGDDLIFTLVSYTQGNAAVSISTDGKQLLFQPLPGVTLGNKKVSFAVSDGSLTSSNVVTVSVSNTKPTAAPVSTSTNHAVPVVISPLSSCSDADGDSLSISSVGSPSKGSVSISADKSSLVYKAHQGVGVGSWDSFSYTCTDGIETATSSINVTILNTIPVAKPDVSSVHWSTALSTPQSLDVRANDVDADGDSLVITSAAVTSGSGSASVNSAGTLVTVTYSGSAKSNGWDNISARSSVFTYKISDGADTASSTWTISITNNVPSFSQLSKSVHWRDALNGVVLDILAGKATDVDGDSLVVSTALLQVPNSNIALSIGNTGTGGLSAVTYKPSIPYATSGDIVNMVIIDGLDTVAATANVTVTDAVPTAAEVSYTYRWTSYNTAVDIAAIMSDSDVQDANYLVVQSCVVKTPASGSNAVVSVSSNTKGCNYKSAGFNGMEVLEYTVSDGFKTAKNLMKISSDNTFSGVSAEYNVHWKKPATTGQIFSTLAELKALVKIPQDATISSIGQYPAFGVASVPSGQNQQWQYVYSPAYDASGLGDQQLSLTVSTAGGSASSQIPVTLHVFDNAPSCGCVTVSNHWSFYVTGVSVNVTQNSYDSDSADVVSLKSFDAASSLSGSIVAGSSNGVVKYTASAPFVGKDSFNFVATDGLLSCTGAVSVVSSNNVASPASASASTNWGKLASGYTFDLSSLANADPDGDALTFSAPSVTAPTYSITSLGGTRYSIVSSDPKSQSGKSVVVTFTTKDMNGAGTAVANTFTLQITNQKPVAVDDGPFVVAAQSTSGVALPNVLANDKDADGDVLTISSLEQPVCGQVWLDAAKTTITYKPCANTGLSTTTTFRYKITDTVDASDWATVTVKITDNAPTAGSLTFNLGWQDSLSNIDLNAPATNACKDIDSGDDLRVNFLFSEIRDKSSVSLGKVLDQSVASGLKGNIGYQPNANIAESSFVNDVATHEVYYSCRDIANAKSNPDGVLTFKITNKKPVAVDIGPLSAARIPTSGAFPVNVLTYQSAQPDGDSVTVYSASYTGSLGQISFSSTQVVFTPTASALATPAGFTVQISYTLTDGQRVSYPKTITIVYGNTAPKCGTIPSFSSIGKDAVLNLGNLASVFQVTDDNSDPVSITIKTTTSKGSFTVANGVGSFTPVGTDSGVVSAQLVLSDGAAQTTCSAFSFTITNQAPIANPMVDTKQRNVNAQTLIYDPIGLRYAFDNDAKDTVSLVSVSAGSGCGASSTVSISSGQIKYVAPSNQLSQCVITYTVQDSDLSAKASAISTVTINFVDGKPVSVPGTWFFDQATTATWTTTRLLESGSYDPNNEPIEVDYDYLAVQSNRCGCSGCCQMASSSFSITGNGQVITYRPDQTFCNIITFQFRVRRVNNKAVVSDPAIATFKAQNCQCLKPMDIVLVWDASGSITRNQWNQIRNFGIRFVNKLDMNQVRVGVVTFGDEANDYSADSDYGFKLQYRHPAAGMEIQDQINHVDQSGGWTNTRSGLYAAHKMINENPRAGVQKAIVVLTDGDANRPDDCGGCSDIPEPTGPNGETGSAYCTYVVKQQYAGSWKYWADCSWCSDSPIGYPCSDPVPQATELRTKYGIRTVALGVGDGLSSYGKTSIQQMSYDNVLRVVGYDDLNTIYQAIVDSTCNA